MKKIDNLYTDIYSYFILKKNINEKMMKRIFSLIRVNSTFMTTSYNRMFDINRILKKYIEKYFSKRIMICDFAISSGQSTYELNAYLDETKIKNIYGFDKNIHIKIYQFKKFIFLYSKKNELLMVEFNKYCLRYRYFFFFKKIEKIFIFLFNYFDIKCKKSLLLIPDLIKVKKFKYFEQDIFNINKKYFNLFDVVRVSNLLNYTYFSESKLIKAISNIKKITKENSIILINRTPNNKKKNTASFFIIKNNKFELLKDINGGSEIKKLVLI